MSIVDEKRLAELEHYSDRDGDFDHHWLHWVEQATDEMFIQDK